MSPGAGLTRRTALKAAAAGSLGGLLASAGCGDVKSSARQRIGGGFVDDGVGVGHRFRDGEFGGARAAREERCRVLVIGGGVAGLSAAWRLARAGVDGISIAELGGEIGGTSRGGAMESQAGGALRCPFGAHYLPQPRTEQRAVAAFLKDAGISIGETQDGRVAVPDRLLVRDPAERIAALGYFEEGLWMRAGIHPEDDASLDRFESLTEDLMRVDGSGQRLFDLPLRRSSTEARELDSVSAADWAAANGFESERMRWYLEYATRDDLGASLADTSAWAMLHYFTARVDLATKESANYLTWPDGNARLVRGLEGLIEPSLSRMATGEIAVSVTPGEKSASAVTVNVATGEATHWTADAIVLATPQFVTRRLLREDPAADDRAAFRYSPWLVANLHLSERPESRGFPYAWDSVLYGSPSLGYVDASHQLDRADELDTVWTWYLPVIDSDERGAREALLARPFESWRDAILSDLRMAHSNIDEVVTKIDVWRWGHAMVKPTPGSVWGGMRQRAEASMGRLHFAHSDLSGIALFEEANWQGTRAAEGILGQLGIEDPSLL
ncbi:MAG: putative NAD/FAD-binding protein [Planctomycetota bacterium]